MQILQNQDIKYVGFVHRRYKVLHLY